MKTKKSTKILSLFLAVLMITTSIPFVALAQVDVSTKWNEIARTDFTSNSGVNYTENSVFNSMHKKYTYNVFSSRWCWMQGNYAYDFNGFKDDYGNTFNWQMGTYLPNDVSNNNAWKKESDLASNPLYFDSTSLYSDGGGFGNKYDENGIYVKDGYLSLSSFNEKQETPITNSNSFKIDLAFSFGDSFTVSKSGDVGFLCIGNQAGKMSSNMNGGYLFAQGAYGEAYVGSTQVGINTGSSWSIDKNNPALSANTEYHYIMTYSKGYVRSYIADTNGDILVNLCGYKANIDTTAIKSITLGDDNNGSFMQGMTYKSISFYQGTENSETITQDPKLDKYLFAYFCDNSAEGERIRFALSDDGTNFEPLNANKPILNNTVAQNTGSGIAASGHSRDPYIFRAQDGSYYVLATDLDTQNSSNFSNNSKLLVWHIEDLSKADQVVPWNIDLQDAWTAAGREGTIQRAWAPQAIWDEQRGEYMLYWAYGYVSENGVGGRTIMYYAYTKDFKTLTTQPKLLISTANDCIDGDISFDGNVYYLYYKDESTKQICYATAEKPSGPYTGRTVFSDSDYSTFEGCQVFRRHSDGMYILMVDFFSNNTSHFVMYSSSSPESFLNNAIGEANVNHCSPRHGSVVSITTDEYEALAKAYGKATYDGPGIYQGEDVNDDTLIARYFTTSDPTYDATGHGYTLTNNGLTAVSNFDGRVATKFTNNGGKNASGNKNGTWASINTSEMFKDIDIKDGITFSWYGYAQSADAGRFFDWTSTEPGVIEWDGPAATQNNSRYVYSAAYSEFGASNHGAQAIATGYKGSSFINGWHLYTMTVTNGYLSYRVDGKLLRTIYSKGQVTTSGSPVVLPSMNDEFFTELKNGNLLFGISAYAADELLNGYISDFRIYKRGLSADEITTSLSNFDALLPTGDVDTSNRIYYDPFEDMDTTGNGSNDKTAYAQTVTDPTEVVTDEKTGDKTSVMGQVLNSNGGVDSKYTYNAQASDNGYTVSTWYNPGAEVSGKTIFTIGDLNGSANNSNYFELNENGTLNYNVGNGTDESYISIADAFGSPSALAANTWSHIVVQVVPNDKYDDIYVYVNGVLTKSTYTFPVGTCKADRSVHDFFGKNQNVYYGKTAGSGQNSNADSYLDDFSIYKGVYSAGSIFNTDSKEKSDTLIYVAMQHYKEKMAQISADNTSVYTNMGPAYDAYDAACRYFDSIKYGDNLIDNAELIQLYTNLETAIANMKDYSRPDTVKGVSTKDSGLVAQIDSKYTQNMLSTVGLNAPKELVGGTGGGRDREYGNASVASSSFVWLYDGENIPTAPINGGVYSNWKTNINYYARSIYVRGGDIAFAGNWKIKDTQSLDWYYEDAGCSDMGYLKDQGPDFKMRTDTTWEYGSNYIKYLGSGPDTNATGADKYYTVTTPLYGFSQYWKLVVGSDNGISNFDIQPTGDIYIISYVPVKEALLGEERVNILKNITDYSPSSAQKLVDAYDALTSQEYILTAVNDASVKDLAATLDEKVNNLLGVDVTNIVKKADYSAVADKAIKEEPTYTEKAQEQNNYTTSSWAAYNNAYHAVKNHFNSLDPFAENENYATSQAQIDTLGKNIDSSREHLMLRADYSPVEDTCDVASVYTEKYNGLIDGNGEQAYAYFSWRNYADLYDSAKVWADKDADYKADTEKYAVTYKKGELAPYIALDADGNVVTDDNTAIDSYKYIGEFYENETDDKPSQFETGDYVLYNGNMIKLNGHRYVPDTINTDNESVRQTTIRTKAQNVQNYNILAPADYSVYDAATNLLKYQDVAAFTENYLNSENSVYSRVKADGTKDTSITYANGVESAKGITCVTPEYSGVESAYVNVGGTVYKNYSSDGQAMLDDTGRAILSALTVANKSTDNTIRRAYDVTFKVDGTQTNSTDSYYYGDTPSFVSPANNVKWVIEVEGKEPVTIPATQRYTLTIQGKTTVTAYVSDTVSENTVKIKVNNIYGIPVNEFTAAADSEFTMDMSYIPNNGNVPCYQFKEWLVGGKTIAGNTFNVSEYANDGVVVVTPIYAPSANSFTINLDGETVGKNDIFFDTKVELASKAENGAYAIAFAKNGNYYVASYNTESYPFYATGDADFYTIIKSVENENSVFTVNGTKIDNDDMIMKLENKLPFTFSIAQINEPDNYYSTFSAPSYAATDLSTRSNVKITEMGTLYVRNNADATAENMVIGGNNVGLIKAKNPDELSSQYFLKINKTNGKFVATRSYVKYSCIIDGTTIQCIDYGNICIKNA